MIHKSHWSNNEARLACSFRSWCETMRTNASGSAASEGIGESKRVAESSGDVAVRLIVQHNRSLYSFEFMPDCTVEDLKERLEAITNVPVNMQKLIFRGILKNDTKIASLRLPGRDTRIMLIGTERDVSVASGQSSVSTPESDTNRENEPPPEEDKETIAGHKHVIETFGKPDNAKASLTVPATLADNETLTGLLDKKGKPLRLRFHPESCELWMATPSATYKIPLDTVKEVEHCPIIEHPGYHIMSFQLGPTRKSRFFIYWVPEQYVASIKKKALSLKPMR
ncbi:ubiquitin domain containing protein UBFD1 [Echinococcus multilocularis]|uniref:Ubiquitin domain containing protein UBFD1 n=1 Tax=Echinococcus multilocularis TaxID=6211 RepID=A0A068Y8J2_ECHMU|nr:ubiquitin domain containing protein UBFD1 [Echinococcus multilocularis]